MKYGKIPLTGKNAALINTCNKNWTTCTIIPARENGILLQLLQSINIVLPGFYICGEHGAYPVMNFLELDDIDLAKANIV